MRTRCTDGRMPAFVRVSATGAIMNTSAYHPNLLIEVTVEQAFERGTVACLVLAHLVHGIVDGIVAEFLRTLRKLELAFRGAGFRRDAKREVLLRIRVNDLAQEFRELGRVFRLFESDALVGFRDFRESFTVRLAAHREVHPDFGAFAREVLTETLHDFRVKTLSDADLVRVRPDRLAGRACAVFLQVELGLRSLALRADFGGILTDGNITADRANTYFHSLFSYGAEAPIDCGFRPSGLHPCL